MASSDTLLYALLGGLTRGNWPAIAAPLRRTDPLADFLSSLSAADFAALQNYASALGVAVPSAPKGPLESAGISLGEFVGWRVWRVREKDRLLASYSEDRIWLPSEPMEGEPHDHDKAGVWAFKDASRAAMKVREVLGPPKHPMGHSTGCGAVGSCWLWGDIIEHADGFRAQYARVRSLDWVGRGLSVMAWIGPADATTTATIEYLRDRRTGNAAALPGPADENLLAELAQRYGVGSEEDILRDEREAQKKSAGPDG